MQGKKRYQHKEGRGTVFKNEHWAEGRPHYKGSCMVEGKDKDVAIWRDKENPDKWSLKFEEPRETNREPPRKQTWEEELGDDVPF